MTDHMSFKKTVYSSRLECKTKTVEDLDMHRKRHFLMMMIHVLHASYAEARSNVVEE